ncbi:probable serine hydrolase isoform X2 [Aethina tumida]|uniref:probable serine hydrolase isoform X2 n=1 Tax=Aethina tumida TaxID=116153 RepID=UPI00096B47F0|nr:probable serine hydrolase isoform X2 [Aethina tumida]
MAAVTNGIKDKDVYEVYEEITIPVPWGHISGKWWGPKNTQPIIAIHGWQDNSGTFDSLAPLLKEKGLSLLCIDLPGHGLSSHLPDGQFYYIFWDGVHFLRRVVKYYKWTEPITVIGHSLGGAIAFLYAAAYPDQIKKYVSIDIASPSVRTPEKMVSAIGAAVDKFLYYETLPEEKHPCYTKEEMLDILVDAHNGSVTRQGCEYLLKRAVKPAKHKEGYYVFTRDTRLKVSSLGFLCMEQVLHLARQIKCEVLNIRGNPGMKFDIPENYNIVLDEIEKSAKKLERHVVDGTHHLHLNDGACVADIIHKFIIS